MCAKNIKKLDYVLKNAIGKECQFEYRPKKYMFGISNYGDIPEWINKADGDPWDIFAPGISSKLPINKKFVIKKILGILLLENGNHKIAIKVNTKGYDKDRCLDDINTYCKKYTKFQNMNGVFIHFT
mgnify:CR=1 FL=1|uniref:Uncharacterized protein n=1 Tax=viral metagenome TaxID=1070528 RepID=A0A6C0F8T1_9ZZZZ|tara:strand:- start:13616 stop:13996 length:381 start_codon:yes stop_codon:yes gene_type:complete